MLREPKSQNIFSNPRRTKALWEEAVAMSGSMIDCSQLTQIMEYWCPDRDARVGRDVLPAKVDWRGFIETKREDNRCELYRPAAQKNRNLTKSLITNRQERHIFFALYLTGH